MPNFEALAKNIQKEAILNEIEIKKRESGDSFDWQSYFNNFWHYLPNGITYEKIIKEENLLILFANKLPKNIVNVKD
jgi:hypothetical protein